MSTFIFISFSEEFMKRFLTYSILIESISRFRDAKAGDVIRLNCGMLWLHPPQKTKLSYEAIEFSDLLCYKILK